MKLIGVELREVRMRLRDPFTSSAGPRSERRVLLIKVRGAEGADGWGECVAGETPAYASETTDTAWYVLTEFILPAVVGREVLGPEEILAPITWIHGHEMAKAALEMAVWDLQARELELPLWELVGGTGEGVPVGIALGLQPDAATLLQKVEEALARGYALVKLKIAPGRDVEIVRSVRGRFPNVRLAVDANGAYTVEDISHLEAMDEFGLSFLEQPFSRYDLLTHTHLQRRMSTAVCLDESITSKLALELALELGACRVVSLKPGQLGGIAAARSCHDLCLAREVPVRSGGMLETGIGRAHNLALATLPGFVIPGDLSESRRYWERDLVEPPWELREGTLAPRAAPGIGVIPDPDRIAELTARRVAFGSLD